jgi:hypothetical protein
MNSRFVVSLLAGAAAVCAVAGTHAAQPTVAQSIGRNATAQTRVASDVARGRLSPGDVAAIESKAADVDRTMADLLVAQGNGGGHTQAAAAERGFAHTVVEAERMRRSDAALQRLHVRVATARDAQQQRRIAHGLRSGHLNAAQASELERAQAAIVAAQADLTRRGGETADDALRMQHLQDVQDWAIRTGHEPGSARS